MEDYEIDLMIAHCKYAIANATNISDVKIRNLGDAVNSSYPDYAPCISLDGKSLVVTSRRGDTKGGAVDVNSDHQYFSDVYISTWNEETKEWNPSESIPGKINTEYYDAAFSFMPSGELLLYRNITGATRSGDIYFSKQSASSGKWGSPREMMKKEGMHKKLNSTYFESSACMTEDGKSLYFISDRPGGQGQADIYVMKKKGREWSEPENLGATINSTSDEKCVAIHPSGNYIFFSSNGFEDGFGSYDLYYSVKDARGKWSKPVNFGAPINTTKEEKTVAISPDGKTAYVSAFYDIDNRGDADVYEIDISSLNIIK
jgi:Tol biopolymer transport system component